MESSSGGIFTVLAEHILDDGGIVIGVAQIVPTLLDHIVVGGKADWQNCVKLNVQANVGPVFREVRSLLKVGLKVLFTGALCQVAGLYAVLCNTAVFVDLFTVDIVCHGSPSVKVFEKYVREMGKKGNSALNGFNSRDKSDGWSGYALQRRFESGKTVLMHHCGVGFFLFDFVD